MGTVNTTVNGWTCQAWTSDSPHERPEFAKIGQNYPDASIEAAENYCRNPSDLGEGVWCYTTNPDVPWEQCDIPLCNVPHGKSTLSIALCATVPHKQKIENEANSVENLAIAIIAMHCSLRSAGRRASYFPL